MFCFPIAPSWRIAAHPLASIIPRARTSIPPSQSSPRFFSTPSTIKRNTRHHTPISRTVSWSFPYIPRRPVARTSRRYYSNGYNRYRRFDGPGGEPFVLHLVRNAKPIHFVMIGGLIGGVYVYNTETVEMTGRRRFNCVSHQQELKMGAQSYHEVLREYQGRILRQSHPLSVMVNRVLQRLIPLAPIYGANWEVHVIQDDNMVNAFVLPGGKVFVFTGILPICRDEDGLAAVLGHEIAHVVAHHTGERMSNNLITMGVIFLTEFLFDVSGNIPSLLLNLMYSLPNSRTQEAEADDIGLMMMSKACFNPEAAVDLWARMQKAEKAVPPQFMSTHPSSYNRMETIRGWMDKAQAEYENSGCFATWSYMSGFRQAHNNFSW